MILSVEFEPPPLWNELHLRRAGALSNLIAGTMLDLRDGGAGLHEQVACAVGAVLSSTLEATLCPYLSVLESIARGETRQEYVARIATEDGSIDDMTRIKGVLTSLIEQLEAQLRVPEPEAASDGGNDL